MIDKPLDTETDMEQLMTPASPSSDTILNAALVLALIVSLVGISVLLTFSPRQPYTEFYLLNGNGSISTYLDTISPTQEIPLRIGIGNHEGRSAQYLTEIYQANVSYNPDLRSTTIGGMRRLDFFELNLSDGRNVEVPYTLKSSLISGNTLILLLFKGNATACTIQGVPRLKQSYRYLFLTLLDKNPDEEIPERTASVQRTGDDSTPAPPPVVFIELANVTEAGEQDPNVGWACPG